MAPTPKKRPRSSYIRFEAAMPGGCWQADFTHYRLAGGADTEILTWLDDCTRYALSVTAHERVTGPITQGTFKAACDRHGIPASTLTDNGLVFTTRLAGGRGGKNALEHELARLGVTQKNSRPNRPTTCGKVERFQQTMKKHLAAQASQPATLAELQALIDAFCSEYNERGPHRSLPHHATPAAIYTTRPKAPRRPHRNHRSRPRPHRHHRQSRVGHPAPQQETPPHRHRPHPRRHPRPAHRRKPRHPRPQRDHRRNPPRAHPRPGL
nr:DDE-type integrase/transposase/recombinase [Glycomyces arizonensis]